MNNIITINPPTSIVVTVTLRCGHQTRVGSWQQRNGTPLGADTSWCERTDCQLCTFKERVRREEEDGIKKCSTCGDEIPLAIDCSAEVRRGTGWGVCPKCVIRALSRFTEDARVPERVYTLTRDALSKEQCHWEGVSRAKVLAVFPEFFHFAV